MRGEGEKGRRGEGEKGRRGEGKDKPQMSLFLREFHRLPHRPRCRVQCILVRGCVVQMVEWVGGYA